MKTILGILSIIAIFIALWFGFAYRDVDYIKLNGVKYLQSLGYEVIGSDGFTGGLIYGGDVYYQAKRIDTPNLLYSIAVVEWNGELQSWRPEVINTNLIQNN